MAVAPVIVPKRQAERRSFGSGSHGNETLKMGTLRGILRDIEMSPDEFTRLWNE